MTNLSRENLNAINISDIQHTQEDSNTMADLFIADAAKICNVDKRTFDKLAVRFKIRTKTLPNGWRMFNKADVLKVAAKLPKKRQHGLPLIP